MINRLTRRLGRASLAALAGLCLVLAAPSALQAQESTTAGSIVGQVVNPDGTPATNARVIVTSIQRGTTNEVLTNDEGRFVVPLLQPGSYRVRAESPPQPAAELPSVTVNVGQRTTVTMELRPVEVQDIGVEVGRGGVDAAEGGVVDLVTEEQVSSLPTPGRDFTDFISLSGLVSNQPGITTGGQFSIGGARTSGTNIQIDGADANNSFFSENRGSSRVPFTFSLESIQEFQVITNGFDVEYGRFSGGVVNAVTKSGGNEFEGSAHFFWRDEQLTTDNFDGTSPTDFQAFQFGGTMSGPIVEDKLHYFASGDFQQWDQPTFALTPERTNIHPDTIQRMRDILVNTYGFEQSYIDDQFGTFTETEDQANLFGRLDYTLSDDHRLTLRANYSDFTNSNDRLFESGLEARTAGSTFEDQAISVVGEWNAVFTRDVYNTLRVQYSYEDRPRPGNSDLPNFGIQTTTRDDEPATMFFGGENFGITFANRLEEKKIQVTDNLTLTAGDHTFKVGTDNIFTNIRNKFWLNGNGLTTFESLDQFESQSSGFYFRFTPSTEDPQPPVADFAFNQYAVYAQDQWQATDRLLLTAGLRYDLMSYPDEGPPLENDDFAQAVQSFGLSVETVPEDTDNWGPRLSFTYDLQEDESQVLRGGAGIFYGPMPGVTHGNVLQSTPRPNRFFGCVGPSWQNYRNMDGPGNVPTSADDFAAFCFADTPEMTIWGEDVEQSTTYKANLGYEQRLAENWRASIQGIFTRTTNLFGAVNNNLDTDLEDGTGFSRPSGRPVFVNPDTYDPTPEGSDIAAARVNEDLRTLYTQVSNGEARAYNLKLEFQGNPTEDLRLAGNYTMNFAYDNSTTECCTGNALLFDTPTAGNPNFLGDPGDDEDGSWGPSKTQRRHVVVLNAMWDLPAGFEVSGIYRGQSGNPFTPSVNGDLNFDGEAENDRPYLPDPDNPGASGYAFASSSDLDRYRGLLNEYSCLQDAVGSIISRNTCSNPWWHSVDVKVKKTFQTVGDQSFDVIVDMFNVLDGLGMSAGEFVFREDELFQVEGYDSDTDQVTVSTGQFGREIPVGFTPFQFQAQVGVQYHF
ncbi:MAG: TonB-dependent receptor [Candidatus Palauibacterales bacterium]|nr:TonB-dependent receptor [Candidatus Palauibacterales bacterium]